MSVLRGCVTGHYVFITRFWELNKTNHQGTFWGMSSLKRIQSNLFFFFFPCVQRVSSSDWLMSVGYLFLPPNWYAAFWNESLPAVVSAVWRMGAGWDCLCFFFFFLHFFFFFASSSDMASLGGGVSPSESFHPHQGSRAVTTGIRLITHSPRRLHK